MLGNGNGLVKGLLMNSVTAHFLLLVFAVGLDQYGSDSSDESEDDATKNETRIQSPVKQPLQEGRDQAKVSSLIILQ